MKKNSLYVCLSVSGSKVKGQKNMFFEKAQNYIKHRLGGVPRLDIGS
jgi:hypothetical protein